MVSPSLRPFCTVLSSSPSARRSSGGTNRMPRGQLGNPFEQPPRNPIERSSQPNEGRDQDEGNGSSLWIDRPRRGHRFGACGLREQSLPGSLWIYALFVFPGDGGCHQCDLRRQRRYGTGHFVRTNALHAFGRSGGQGHVHELSMHQPVASTVAVLRRASHGRERR